MDDQYISTKIRGTEVELPSIYRGIVPLSLTDKFFQGQYEAFRYGCWYSLLAYEDSSLTYQFMDAYRLVEIYLDKDEEFKKVRDLEVFGLVIVVMGVADLPNRMLPPLMLQLLQQRRMLGKPTWVYCSLSRDKFAERYGWDLWNALNGQNGTPEQKAPSTQNNRVDPTSV